MSRGLKALVWFAVIGMFFVIMAGALVSKTGSGDGCGASWPLCFGQLVPPVMQVAALIEYSHRVVSGVVGLGVLALAVVLWRGYGHRPEARWLAGASAFFLLLQSGLGAWVVLAPQPKWVLAAHFGISSAAFAAVVLSGVLIYQLHGAGTQRRQPVSDRLRYWAWGSLAYIYAVVYSGAYVRHTNANVACVDWPLCNGQLFPGFSGAVGIQFTHRLFALGAIIALVILARFAYAERDRRPDVYKASVWGAVLVTLQALNGGLVVLTELSLAMVMTHSALITLTFGVLSYAAMQVVPEPAGAMAEDDPEHATAGAVSAEA